ncbi:hypothetical protein M2105_001634 [Paenibacillus sp. PastF-1]|nr:MULTISPECIES: hypothetical protein [unclassified Paenibacillus]MDF9840635.1 hypothetical protein [Paenibacillus sp. PastF-2]MDF9847218.1 hypothetical protein [Paenibacillus sp. PastM-2]MDF9853789.1 hypothetical protein [Paenibacillus sp. PastF-1]MDH6478725.1 hypothetical protein [Paenibacillus sp. PastH-2]MDH6506457.1 hypothetical protein [Paenibacillus sp. PastM-3]
MEIVDIIKRLDELDMGVFGFLTGNLEKSGIIRLEDFANIRKITGIFESGTEELWYIDGEIKRSVKPEVSRNSEQYLETGGVRLTVGIDNIARAFYRGINSLQQLCRVRADSSFVILLSKIHFKGNPRYPDGFELRQGEVGDDIAVDVFQGSFNYWRNRDLRNVCVLCFKSAGGDSEMPFEGSCKGRLAPKLSWC